MCISWSCTFSVVTCQGHPSRSKVNLWIDAYRYFILGLHVYLIELYIFSGNMSRSRSSFKVKSQNGGIVFHKHILFSILYINALFEKMCYKCSSWEHGIYWHISRVEICVCVCGGGGRHGFFQKQALVLHWFQVLLTHLVCVDCTYIDGQCIERRDI